MSFRNKVRAKKYAMAKKSKMTGAREIQRNFRAMQASLNTPMNEASRKALRPTLRQAKDNLKANGNVETGALLSTLSILRDREAPKDKPTYLVGPNSSKSPAYREAYLIEFGVEPHRVGDSIHPGHQAWPFMRPSFEATKDEVIAGWGREIGPAIEKWAAKRVKKAGK